MKSLYLRLSIQLLCIETKLCLSVGVKTLKCIKLIITLEKKLVSINEYYLNLFNVLIDKCRFQNLLKVISVLYTVFVSHLMGSYMLQDLKTVLCVCGKQPLERPMVSGNVLIKLAHRKIYSNKKLRPFNVSKHIFYLKCVIENVIFIYLNL